MIQPLTDQAFPAESGGGHDPFRGLRHDMVEAQLVLRGVLDPRVLDAMRRVPRHLFLPPDQADRAYQDQPLPIGQEQTISQPYMVASMTELLALQPDHRVLEIGTGSGYQTAVLALLAREVLSVERLEPLLEAARKRLKSLGLNNISLHCGDGSLGFPEQAPYDAILVTAACPKIPPALIAQLAEGRRLVAPVGPRDLQELVLGVKTGGKLDIRRQFGCRFVPLIGQQGWREDSR